MKINLEQLLQQEKENVICPDKEMEVRLMSKMQEKYESKQVKGKSKLLRPVAACLGALVLLGGAATAYAAANGISLSQLFVSGWGKQVATEKVETYVRDYQIVSEKETFSDIDITPVQVVSDNYLTYVMLKVEGNDKVLLEDALAFRDGKMAYEGTYKDKNAVEGSLSMVRFVRKEGNVAYYNAIILTTNEISAKENGKYSVNLKDLAAENGVVSKGEYELRFEMEKKEVKSLEVTDEKLGKRGSLKIFPLSMEVTIDLEDKANETFVDSLLGEATVDQNGLITDQNANVWIYLKDGTKVNGEVHGGDGGKDGSVARIYITFEDILKLENIQSVEMGDIKVDVK